MDTERAILFGLRLVAFGAGLYVGIMIIRFVIRTIKRAYRAARSFSTEQIARSAGVVSAKVERKASSLSEAFKQGRDK